MTDTVNSQTRLRMMSGIRGKDTKPELQIRLALHKRGFRYCLHYKRLPGKPDLVLPKYSAIVLLNGCFWHCHDCHLFKWPSTRKEFWHKKITENKLRDQRNIAQYRRLGWKTLTIWECSLKGKTRLGLEQVIETTTRWIQFDTMDAEITGRTPD
ncbi:DNA mismatch endonuclease Vsr [Spongiibacter sp. KMU-166]|uniref:Very short patch repair endonuclease n=1 Tax=Spongiibacter thalassae TaxID=2721624 RepID=A0ABX1GHA1_9GAMM|nr:very short patch repair endonuclease [Spongiibacter thalassae]NKI18531.1 DNA mismatch endonuclease Vsr [Spongiibacter thalassae]